MQAKENLNSIKNEIFDYISQISVKRELNISEIINFLFYGKIKNLYLKENAFIRTLKMNIDNIINRSNYTINYKNFIEGLEEISYGRSIIKELSDENILKDFNIDINNLDYENLKFLISQLFGELMKIENNNEFIKFKDRLNYTCFIEKLYNLLKKKKYIFQYSKNVCLLLMYYISIPFIIQIETNNYNILITKYFSQFRDLEIARVIEEKMGNIYKLIENYFTEDDNEEEDFIQNVKNYIKEKDNNDYKELLELDIDFFSLIDNINVLIKGDKIKWLDEKENSKISFEAFLYFHQNFVN